MFLQTNKLSGIGVFRLQKHIWAKCKKDKTTAEQFESLFDWYHQRYNEDLRVDTLKNKLQKFKRNVVETPKNVEPSVIEVEKSRNDDVMEVSDSESSSDEKGIFTVPASAGFPFSRRTFHFINYKDNDWSRGLKRLLCKLIEVNETRLIKKQG